MCRMHLDMVETNVENAFIEFQTRNNGPKVVRSGSLTTLLSMYFCNLFKCRQELVTVFQV